MRISQIGREDEEKGAEDENERKSVSLLEKPTDEAQITLQDVQTLRTIAQDGKRKSINDFTSEDIQKAEKWARKFYKELGIKSPFFRAWYGDWRSEDKSTAKVVEHKKKENGLKAIVIEYNINEKYYRITSKNYSKKPAKVDEEINN